jgi:hypothetical protein
VIPVTDDYRRRMLAISEQLAAQGVGSHTSAPPAYRIAWLLGLRVRPPLYQPFATLAQGMGTGFGVLWGVLMWIIFWRPADLSAYAALGSALLAGTLFGLTMAAFYRWKAGRLRLPPLDGE